ncbi:MAG: EamA family transporter [Cyanophyceae cyanobacterium]
MIEIPPLGDRFWLALVVSGILNTLAWLMYIKAINSSDLSLTVPLITFTPLFLLVTSPVMVGEYPTSIQAFGILLIVIGSHTLNLRQRHQGVFAPFRALLEQTGPKLMLGVAFIWSFTANIDKIGVQNSSPTLWSIALFSAVTVGLPSCEVESQRALAVG